MLNKLKGLFDKPKSDKLSLPDPMNLPPVMRFGSGRPPRRWTPRGTVRYVTLTRLNALRRLEKALMRSTRRES